MVLASASTDGMLKLWDLVSRRVCVELNEHGGRGIIGPAWLAESAQLISQGRDGCIRVWNAGKVWAAGRPTVRIDAAFVMNHRSYTFTRMSTAAATGGLLLAPAANDTFLKYGTPSGTALVAHCVARKRVEADGDEPEVGCVARGRLLQRKGAGLWRRKWHILEQNWKLRFNIRNCAAKHGNCNSANNTQHGAIPKNQGQVAVIVGVNQEKSGCL